MALLYYSLKSKVNNLLFLMGARSLYQIVK